MYSNNYRIQHKKQWGPVFTCLSVRDNRAQSCVTRGLCRAWWSGFYCAYSAHGTWALKHKSNQDTKPISQVFNHLDSSRNDHCLYISRLTEAAFPRLSRGLYQCIAPIDQLHLKICPAKQDFHQNMTIK